MFLTLKSPPPIAGPHVTPKPITVSPYPFNIAKQNYTILIIMSLLQVLESTLS